MTVQRPTGTVAFLFTDVEGSTSLWEAHHDQMAIALARHDAIMSEAVEANGGYVFSTAGDGWGISFHGVADAVATAVAVQRRLRDEPWPDPITLPVRMGIHLGEAQERDGDYFGPVVNRAARVSDAGHGGQVLLSETAAGFAGELATVDLGTHHLKGVDEPIGLRQLVVDDLRQEFPPIRSLGAAVSTLPATRTSLLGRAADVSSTLALLETNRLVTLTGVGGCGKTRLAIAAGQAAIPSTPGGVFFVDLSRINDDHLVAAAAFADGIGLDPTPDSPIVAQIVRALTARKSLVVIDNCEHLLDVVAELVEELLEGSPDVRVLATSREALEIDGERTTRVQSLRGDDAIALFLDRADARLGTDDGASLSAETLAAITQICTRLDGLPLAIELAAARTSMLSVTEIRDRLDDRFRLLTSGRRRTRGRQQTLEATIDWSFDLLEAHERSGLLALSVMPGSFDVTLAGGVLGLDELDALDLVERLAARSLVATEDSVRFGSSRYRLLETIRVYAADRLRVAGASDEVLRRYATHLATTASATALGPMTAATIGLADDHLAAHDWATSSDDAELATALAVSHVIALLHRGLTTDAAAAAEAALENGALTSSDRTHLHQTLVTIAVRSRDFAKAYAHADAAVALDPSHPATSASRVVLGCLTVALDPTRFGSDLAALTEISEQTGAVADRLYVLLLSAMAEQWAGDFATAADGFLRCVDGCPPELEWLRAVAVTGFLVSAAASCPADGVRWLDEHPAGLAIADWYRASADGFTNAASAQLAAAIVCSAAGDTRRARHHLSEALTQRETSMLLLPRFDVDLACTLAALHHDGGDHDRAAALATHLGIPSIGLVAYWFWLAAGIEGVPTDQRVGWMRSEPLTRLFSAPPDIVDRRADAIDTSLQFLEVRG